MKTPCELVCVMILPNVRAWIAKEIIDGYKIKEKDVAKALGLTRAAISQYKNRKRARSDLGKKELKIIEPLIKEIAKKISSHELTEFELMKIMCRTCLSLRASLYLCKLHKAYEPRLKEIDCTFCKDLFKEYRKIEFRV